MNIEDLWNKALKNTDILRSRVQGLKTFDSTNVPYILLSESSINIGDTVVRKGEILVDKPSIILPPLSPQFEGFEFDEQKAGMDQNSIINFFLVRGISFPSFKYNNKTQSLDIFEGKLNDAIKHYQDQLQRQENVNTGLMIGPEECWQFSVMIFICTQILKNADTDLKNLWEDIKKRKRP